jgi:hypothetical protein
MRDVLQALRTHIVEDDIDLAADLALRVVGDANAARLRYPLKARSNVDAVAEDVVVIDDDVPDVNADPQFDANRSANARPSGMTSLRSTGATLYEPWHLWLYCLAEAHPLKLAYAVRRQENTRADLA